MGTSTNLRRYSGRAAMNDPPSAQDDMRIAVVTGEAAGIGASTVHLFRQQGWRTYGWGLNWPDTLGPMQTVVDPFA